MNEEQLAEATKGLTEQRDVQINEVTNGFKLIGTSRYVNPGTNQVMVVQQSEAVATVNTAVVEEVKNFLLNGAFGS